MWQKRTTLIILLILGCEVNQGQSRRAPARVSSESDSSSSEDWSNTWGYEASSDHSSAAGVGSTKSSTTVGPSGNGTTAAAGNSTKLATTPAPRKSSRYNYILTTANKSVSESPKVSNSTVDSTHVKSTGSTNSTTTELDHSTKRSTAASNGTADETTQDPSSTSEATPALTTFDTSTRASIKTTHASRISSHSKIIKIVSTAEPSADSTEVMNSTEPAPLTQLPRYETSSLPPATTTPSSSNDTSPDSENGTTDADSSATSVVLARDKLAEQTIEKDTASSSTPAANETSTADSTSELNATSAANSTEPGSNSTVSGDITVQNVTLDANSTATTVGLNSTLVDTTTATPTVDSTLSANSTTANSSISENSTMTPANVTLTANSTATTPVDNSTLQANATTPTPIQNSTLDANSSSTAHNVTLHVNTTTPTPINNSTLDANSSSPQNATLDANATTPTTNNSTLHANVTTPTTNNSTLHANATTPTTNNSTLHADATTPTTNNSTLSANTTATTPAPVSTQHANTTATTASNSTTVRPLKSTTPAPNNGTALANMQSTSLAGLPTVITSSTIFNFVVNNTHTSVPCLLSNMSVDLKALYLTSDQTVSSGTLHVPQTANSSGTCGDRHAQLIITWREAGKSKTKRSIPWNNAASYDDELNILVFNFINDGKKATLDSLQGSIYLDQYNFPNSAEKTAKGQSTSGLGLFGTVVNTVAYVCNISTDVKAGDIDVTIREVSIITFNTDIDLSAKSVVNCQAQAGINLVALFGGLFGVALLICIALFLITRRKKNLYQSSQIP